MKCISFGALLLGIFLFVGNVNAYLVFDEGTITVDYALNDYVTITDSAELLLVEGGSISGSLAIRDYASFTMTGGSIGTTLHALGSGTVTIKGGTLGGEFFVDPQKSLISGDIHIYGSDFKINGNDIEYGLLDEEGRLTGILENGDLFNNEILFRGGSHNVYLSPVPEPATLFLMSMGIFCLKRKK